jgi:hypothetical protein
MWKDNIAIISIKSKENLFYEVFGTMVTVVFSKYFLFENALK